MPVMETFLKSLNQLTTRERIVGLNAENYAAGMQLSDRIRTNLPNVELSDVDPDVLRYEEMAAILDDMPIAIHDTIREVIRGAIPRGQGITFAWRPGYDWKVEVTESYDSVSTYGGITVLIESRYPGDTHPLQASSAS